MIFILKTFSSQEMWSSMNIYYFTTSIPSIQSLLNTPSVIHMTSIFCLIMIFLKPCHLTLHHLIMCFLKIKMKFYIYRILIIILIHKALLILLVTTFAKLGELIYLLHISKTFTSLWSKYIITSRNCKFRQFPL